MVGCQMELPHRPKHDVFVPKGGFRQLVDDLQQARSVHDWSIVICYAFDRRTRLLPFRWVDRRVVPCGVRSIAASLRECGFQRTRTVLQQWTPNFSPSATVRAGFPIDLLLVSSMGLHAEKAYRMVRDAHSLGANRPLILIGGPKAIYEPEDCFGIGNEIVGQGVDAACTGEEYVLLHLLSLLADEACAFPHDLRPKRLDGRIMNGATFAEDARQPLGCDLLDADRKFKLRHYALLAVISGFALFPHSEQPLRFWDAL